MHPETKKLTQKNMPYLTLTENLKLQLSPGLVASSQETEWVYSSVGRYHGTTVEPRYLFFTVPVPSKSRYYRGTAIPRIPRYYRTVLANK